MFGYVSKLSSATIETNGCKSNPYLFSNQNLSDVDFILINYQQLKFRSYIQSYTVQIWAIQMQSPLRSSFIDFPAPCRPLLTTAYKAEGEPVAYINLPYNYLLKDIKSLQNYLCSSVKQLGVDFLQKQEPLPKLKYSSVFFNGLDKEGTHIKVGDIKDYQLIKWTINIAIPFNSNNTLKQDLKNSIIANLALFQKDQNIPISQQLVSLQKIRNSIPFLAALQGKKNQKERTKGFVNKIPISILLPRRQRYQRIKLIQIIAEDIASSISIMIKNELEFRVVEHNCEIIPIQNYMKTEFEKDPQFYKFIAQAKVIEPLAPVAVDIPTKQASSGKNSAKIFFIAISLLLLIGSYAFIKLS